MTFLHELVVLVVGLRFRVEVFDDVGVARKVFLVVSHDDVCRFEHVPSVVDSPPQVGFLLAPLPRRSVSVGGICSYQALVALLLSAGGQVALIPVGFVLNQVALAADSTILGVVDRAIASQIQLHYDTSHLWVRHVRLRLDDFDHLLGNALEAR